MVLSRDVTIPKTHSMISSRYVVYSWIFIMIFPKIEINKKDLNKRCLVIHVYSIYKYNQNIKGVSSDERALAGRAHRAMHSQIPHSPVSCM